MTTMMVYGATGYTGRPAGEHVAADGLAPVLGGRDGARLAALATELGVDYRAFGVDDVGAVRVSLDDVSVLRNCAGPFMHTARPLMAAAIDSGVHYLDTAAELDSYQLAEAFDVQAKDAGVMLLPGGGGSVAMLGCLAGHAAPRVGWPRRIHIALHVAGSMSRGSAISAGENLSTDCLQRTAGTLTARNPNDTRQFDFGCGPVTCSAVTLPDLITIWRDTEVPDIETFVHVSGNAFPEGDLAVLPDGPTPEERERDRYQAAVEVTEVDGSTARAVLDAVNGYTLTPMSAVAAARRVLDGEFRPGFQTPASLFGIDFAESIADTRIADLSHTSTARNPMQVGINCSSTDRSTFTPVDYGRAVEDRGFDSIFLAEHTHIPSRRCRRTRLAIGRRRSVARSTPSSHSPPWPS